MMMGMHRNALMMIYDKCIGNDKCYIHCIAKDKDIFFTLLSSWLTDTLNVSVLL